MDEILATVLNNLSVTVPLTVEPVSYTHLDVYKRQGTDGETLPRYPPENK